MRRRGVVLGTPLAVAAVGAVGHGAGPPVAEGVASAQGVPTPRPVPQRTPVPPRRPVGVDLPVTAVLAEGRPVAVSVYGRPATVELEPLADAVRRLLESAGARLVLEYSPALPPAEADRLLGLVATGGVPGGALSIPDRPVDFRVTVESRPLTPDQEQTFAEGVQVRLTLPAFPPHPSAGGTFLWVHGLYDAAGTLTGVAPVPPVVVTPTVYVGSLPAGALQFTAFLPVQAAPVG